MTNGERKGAMSKALTIAIVFSLLQTYLLFLDQFATVVKATTQNAILDSLFMQDDANTLENEVNEESTSNNEENDSDVTQNQQLTDNNEEHQEEEKTVESQDEEQQETSGEDKESVFDKISLNTNLVVEKYMRYDNSQGKGVYVEGYFSVYGKTDDTQYDSIEITTNIPQLNGINPNRIEISNSTTDVSFINDNENIMMNIEYSDSSYIYEEYSLILTYPEEAFDFTDIDVSGTIKVKSSSKVEETELEDNSDSFDALQTENDEKIENVLIEEVIEEQEFNISKKLEQEYIDSYVENEITSENASMYKGYLLANLLTSEKHNMEYTSIEKVEIKNADLIDEIEVTESEDKFIDASGSEYSLLGINRYSKTLIKAEDVRNILGEEGKVEIYNSSDELLGQIDSNSVENDGYFEINYETNVSSIKIKIINPETSGTLEIKSVKEIGETNFSRPQIGSFKNIETNSTVSISRNITGSKVVLKEINLKNSINLENTESKIDMTLSTINFSTEMENDVTFNVTLESNQERYELFENPIIEVILPLSVEEVSINSINLLYKNGLSIKDWTVEKSETGEQVIKVTLSGKQEEYNPESLIEGTTIVINSTIKLDEFTANGKSNVKLRYENQAGTNTSYSVNGKEAEEYEINYVSKSGLVKSTTFENFNNTSDVIFNLNDEKEIGTLDVNSSEKVSKMSMKVLNNYDTVLKDVYILGRIPSVGNVDKNGEDLKSTLDLELRSQITVNGLSSTIYYSNKVDAEKDDESWTEEVTDLSEIRSYKIVLNSGEMKKGEMISFEYDLAILENLSYNEKAYGVYDVIYTLNGETITEESLVGMETETKELGIDDCQTKESLQEAGLEIGTQVTRAGEVVNEGDEVNEGQILTYTAILKNTSSTPITNIKLQGNAENANSYYWYTYEMESSTDGSTITTGKYKEDTDGTHLYDEVVVDVLNPGENYTFTYKVKVKHLSDITTNELYGKVTISADGIETQEITSIKNTIRKAYVELSIKQSGQEDINDNSIGSGGAYYLETTVKNITSDKLKNVPVTIFISKELETNDYTKNELFDVTLVNIEEVADGTKITVEIPEIDAGEEFVFLTTVYTKSLDLDIENTTSTVYATSEINDVVHISNEYKKTIFQSETKIETTFTSNIANYSKVNDGDKVTYTIGIENVGTVSKYITIVDKLPYGFIADNVYATESDENIETVEVDDNRKIVETYYLEGKSGVTIVIEGTISADDLRTDQTTIVSNYSISLEESGNEDIVFYIDNIRDSNANDVVEDEIIEEVPIEDNNTLENNSENDETSNDNNFETNIIQSETFDINSSNTTQTSENTNENNTVSVSSLKYSVSGKVWLDKNEDGLYKNEDLIENINVYLYKTDSNNIKDLSSLELVSTQETDNSGEYKITGIETGKYVAIFEYDNAKYNVTKYQANGTRDSKSSDVISKELTINKETKKYAISDVLEISETSILNLNMGLIQNKDFDLEIKTYISKVTVENGKGTEETTFDENDSLAKIEIASKYLDGSIVTSNYVLKVTNNGVEDGYVNQLSFSIPEGFELVGNTTWQLSNDGNLYNSSLSKEAIASGETREFTITLQKTMTTSNTGSFKSEAKIVEATNNLQLADYDESNNISSIELIITIKTGAVYYVLVLVIITLMAAIAIIIINRLLKNKNSKKIKLVDRIIICVSIIILISLCLIIKNYAYNVTVTGNTIIETNDLANGWSLSTYLNYSRSSLAGLPWKIANNIYLTNQCVEPSNNSNYEYNVDVGGSNRNCIVSVVDIVGKNYDRDLVTSSNNTSNTRTVTTSSSSSSNAAFVGYLAYKLESYRSSDNSGLYGSYVHTYSGAICKGGYASTLSSVLGYSMSSPNSGNNAMSYSTTVSTLLTEANNYASSLGTSGTGSLSKSGSGNIDTINYSSSGGYGPICLDIPDGATSITLKYTVDGGSEQTISNVIVNGSTVSLSSTSASDINKKVFYIPASVFSSISSNSTVKVYCYANGASTIQAKVTMCIGGGQNRVIMRGQKSSSSSEVDYNVELSGISVNKYITTGNRSSMSESEKQNSPANASIDETLTYNIVVTNTYGKAVTVTLKDTFQTNKTNGGLVIASSTGWTAISSNSYQRTITVPANSSTTVTLKVKTYTKTDMSSITSSVNYSETYKNTVTMTGSGLNITKSTSSDYVTVGVNMNFTSEENEPTATIQKYISAVNGVAVSGRENRTSNDKYQDPVVVKKGDIVTYTIKVTNTTAATTLTDSCNDSNCSHLKNYGKIYSCNLTDVIEDGLTITSQSGLTNFSVARGQTYTATVTARVDKTNLYLYNLENQIKFSSGKYTKYRQIDVVTDVLYYVYDVTDTITSLPSNTKNWTGCGVSGCTRTKPHKHSWTGCTETSGSVSCANPNKPHRHVWYGCGVSGCTKTNAHTHTAKIATTANISLSSGTINTINASNKNKDYVRLKELTIAGNVFVDKNKDGYNNDSSNLSGITVILHDVTSGSSTSTTTDSNGHYQFTGFYKGTNFTQASGKTGYYPTSAVHKEYYLEYQYNGEKYISTTYSGRNNLGSDNSYNVNYLIDSNACEYTAERTAFNQSLETIAYNKGVNRKNNNSQKTLTFTKSEHISTLQWTSSTTMSSYSFVNSASSGTKYNLFLSTDGETDYLEHINLGLQERERLDLKLTKDLMESQVRINGYTMNYDYGQLAQNTLYDKSDIYQLYLYKSDYNYRYEMYKNQAVRNEKGTNSELQVDLTYKITIYNESTDSTYAKINEVVDFYTDKMTVKDGTVYMIKNGTKTALTIADSSTYNSEQSYSFSGYRTKFIKGMDSVVLAKGESLDIYITYTVDKDTARAIYLGEKTNIAQISAYSSYEEASGTTPKGLVDIDSNAGNVNANAVKVTETDKYEDNTFRVRTNISLKTTERKISGFVFEDARSEKVGTFNQFTGNGIYNSSNARNSELVAIYQDTGMTKNANQDLYNDKKLDGMTVELVEIVTVNGTIYEETIDPVDTTNKENVIVRTQTSEGKYEITSFIPGTYIVRFRYGDIYKDNTITSNSLIHNGQDYKSTTYTLTDNSGNVLESTADNDVKYAALTQANKSDARDNEYRRIEVMAESEVMTNTVAEFMKYTQYDVNNVDQSLKDFSEATNCFADTVTFSLGIENKSDTKNSAGVEVAYRNFNEISLSMPNIDYGVVFRPENFIKLTKKIKSITINTSDGNTILSLKYTEDGSIDSNENQVGIDLVQAVDTLAGVQGFRYINIDEDLMQGATVSIEYYLLADNVGEVDTVNQRLIDEGGSTAVKEKLQSSESVLYSTSATGSETYKNYSRMNDLIKQAYGSSDSYYYGRYLGGIYYNGASYSNLKTNAGTSISTETVVVPVTVNRIIDWIDNDATFVATNNSENNKFWTSTTETELIEGGLVGAQGLYVQNGVYYYKDEDDRKYTTETRKNIAISSDKSSINSDLIKPLYPELYTAESLDTRGRVTIEINANLSAGENENNMTYDNVAELAKFTTVTGRRTNFASTIGNIKLTDTTSNKTPFGASKEEVDQAGTETVNLVPPTGMTLIRLFIAYNMRIIEIIACTIGIILVGTVGIRYIKLRKRFYLTSYEKKADVKVKKSKKKFYK